MGFTATFEAERPRLFGLAYRMLGSVADADDVVQDAWLRWQGAEHASIDNPAGFLTTVTSRLAIDRLRSAQRRRESYVGPWLPEPLAVVNADDPESAVLMDESIMLGFLAVLERLGAVERAVFVLKEVFDLPYPEVAAVVDRTEDNCRQIAKRAREHVRAERPRMTTDVERDRGLLDAFLTAVMTGDPAELEGMLHDDIVLVSDGGPDVRAARRPVLGVFRVARFCTGIAKHAPPGDVTVEYVMANGQLALFVEVDGRDSTLLMLEPDATGQRISRIFALRNPDKLRTVRRAARRPTRRLSSGPTDSHRPPV